MRKLEILLVEDTPCIIYNINFSSFAQYKVGDIVCQYRELTFTLFVVDPNSKFSLNPSLV